MKLKEPLSFAGHLYASGENVKGKLPLDFIEVLRSNNKLLEEEGLQEEIEEVAGIATEEDEISGNKLVSEYSLQDLGQILADITDVDQVSKMLQDEMTSENPRAGAIKLLEKRLKELQE